MSAPMKKRLTKSGLMLRDSKGKFYIIPKKIAAQYEIDDEKNSDTILAKEFFAPYEKKYTKPGLLLRGLRIREGLTQEDLAEKLNVTQANLSHMECGRRKIGREIAQRIENLFDINYRDFLE